MSFTVNDGSTNSNTQTRDITITTVNDDPVNTVPGTQAITEDTTTAISGISIADADAGSSPLTTRLQVTTGVLNVTLSGSATISAGANASSDITIQGSATDINATLTSLTYRGNANVSGTNADTLTVTTNDLGNTGSGGAKFDVDTVQINLTAVNDTPDVVGSSSAYTVNEQTNLNIHGSGFSVTDVDAAAGPVTATITVGEGAITVAAGNSGVTISSGNGTGNVTVTGTLAQINNLLTGGGTGTIVYFNSSNTPSASTTITVIVNDGGNTGTDPGLTGNGSSEEDSASQTINLTALNDAPTNAGSLPTDITVTEDIAINVDLSAIDFSDVDAGSSSLTVTLSTSTGGQLSIATGTGITLGGTVTARTFTGSLANLNAYFNTASNITYLHSTPHLNGNDADTITVVINDNGSTGSGGGTCQALGTVNVDITAVNDSPLVGTNTGTTVAEGGTVTITSAMLNEFDVDDTGVGLTYTVTSGPTNGRLELTTSVGVAITTFTQDDVNNNRVVFVHDGTQSTVDSFGFSLSDGGEDGATPVTGTFNFTVTNVNDAPVASSIEGTPLAYTENAGAVAITSTISISDPDDTNIESAVVAITANYASGQDILAFTTQNGITGTWNAADGKLNLTGSATLAQYEAALRSITYTNTSNNPSTAIRVVSFTVNDGDANSNTQSRDIAINTVNDAPVGVDDNFSINEDGVLSNNALTNDYDDDLLDTLTVVLSRDVDHGKLTLQAGGQFTFTPDQNYTGSDLFTYQVFDGTTYSSETTVFFSINAVNDAPLVTDHVAQVNSGETINKSGANGLLANAMDIEGDALTAVLVVGPSSGNLVLNADGSWSFDAASGFYGQVTFTYSAFDGSASSSPATVTIVVIAGGLPPLPPPDDPIADPDPERNSDSDPVPDVEINPTPMRNFAPELTVEPSESDPEASKTDQSSRNVVPVVAELFGGEDTSINAEGLLRLLQNGQAVDSLQASWKSYSQMIHTMTDYSEEPSKLNFIVENRDLQLSLNQFQSQDEKQQATLQLKSGVAATLFVGASAGFATWCVGGSYLISLITSSLPTWAGFDVIHIVDTPTRHQKENDKSVAEIIATGIVSESQSTT